MVLVGHLLGTGNENSLSPGTWLLLGSIDDFEVSPTHEGRLSKAMKSNECRVLNRCQFEFK